VRLRHGQGGTHFTVDDRLQPARFLIVPGNLLQHQHVAVVGGRAIEHRRPEQGSAHFLVTGRHADGAESLPAALAGHLRAPKSCCPRFGAKRIQHVVTDVFACAPGIRVGFQRQNVLGDEFPDPQPERVDIGGEREIHGLARDSG
jgi:hypothetical protein